MRKVIRAEKMVDGRVPTSRQVRVQFWGKVAAAGYTPPFFGHGRVKVGVDQSAVLVSRYNKVDTLLYRFLTWVYPVVSFTLLRAVRRGHQKVVFRRQKRTTFEVKNSTCFTFYVGHSTRCMSCVIRFDTLSREMPWRVECPT